MYPLLGFIALFWPLFELIVLIIIPALPPRLTPRPAVTQHTHQLHNINRGLSSPTMELLHILIRLDKSRWRRPCSFLRKHISTIQKAHKYYSRSPAAFGLSLLAKRETQKACRKKKDMHLWPHPHPHPPQPLLWVDWELAEPEEIGVCDGMQWTFAYQTPCRLTPFLVFPPSPRFTNWAVKQSHCCWSWTLIRAAWCTGPWTDATLAPGG